MTQSGRQRRIGAIEGGGTKFVCVVGEAGSSAFAARAVIPTRDAAATLGDCIGFFRDEAARSGPIDALQHRLLRPLQVRPRRAGLRPSVPATQARLVRCRRARSVPAGAAHSGHAGHGRRLRRAGRVARWRGARRGISRVRHRRHGHRRCHRADQRHAGDARGDGSPVGASRSARRRLRGRSVRSTAIASRGSPAVRRCGRGGTATSPTCPPIIGPRDRRRLHRAARATAIALLQLAGTHRRSAAA